MNGKDWRGYCPEHAAVVLQVERNTEGLKMLQKEQNDMKVQIAVMRVKLALMVTLASAVGGIVANAILHFLTR